MSILTPAIRLAAGGFPAGPLLALVVTFLDDAGKRELHELADQAVRPGALVRRPGVALTLQAIARGGRDAFYGGAFGEGLVHRGAGLFTEADLEQCQADWVDVLSTDVFGVELCSLPPNSQGYLTLGTARLAADAGLPRRSRRGVVGPPADRGGDRRGLRPAGEAARGRRRRRPRRRRHATGRTARRGRGVTTGRRRPPRATPRTCARPMPTGGRSA